MMWDLSDVGNDEKHLLTLGGSFVDSKYVCFEQDFEQLKRMGFETKECGNVFAFPMFYLFIVLISMMILNMFIAVVLEGFSESMKDSLRCVNTDN